MELQEFLNKVVGMGSLSHDDEGRWKIQPFEVVTTDESNYSKKGYITFKGARFQEFHCSLEDFKTVQGMNESLNYGYTQAIKDVLVNGNVSSTIKPFKFV